MKHFISTSILEIANKTSTGKIQWFSYERFLFVGSHSLAIISQQPAACQLFFICYWYIPACQNRYLAFSKSTATIEHQGIVLGQRDNRTGHWHKAGLNNQTKHGSDQRTCGENMLVSTVTCSEWWAGCTPPIPGYDEELLMIHVSNNNIISYVKKIYNYTTVSFTCLLLNISKSLKRMTFCLLIFVILSIPNNCFISA